MSRTTMELGAGVVLGGAALLAVSPASFSLPGLSALAVLLIGVGPLLHKGLLQTWEFLRSLSTSKKHGRIDGYNAQFGDAKSADDRNEDYANLVDSYYDLATEFYEWGWGTSFHFADRRKGENGRTFCSSVRVAQHHDEADLIILNPRTIVRGTLGMGMVRERMRGMPVVWIRGESAPLWELHWSLTAACTF